MANVAWIRRPYPQLLNEQCRQVVAKLPLFQARAGAVLTGKRGRIATDAVQAPQVVLVQTQNFWCFGGRADLPFARQLVDQVPPEHAVVVPHPAWRELLATSWGDACRSTRLTVYRNPRPPRWSWPDLQSKVPRGLTLQPLDASTLRSALALAPELLHHFDSGRDFLARGRGLALLEGRHVIALANTVARCEQQAEVGLTTHWHYRGMGLAALCAQALVRDCFDAKLQLSWVAAHSISRTLARRAGFVRGRQVEVYYRDRPAE